MGEKGGKEKKKMRGDGGSPKRERVSFHPYSLFLERGGKIGKKGERRKKKKKGRGKVTEQSPRPQLLILIPNPRRGGEKREKGKKGKRKEEKKREEPRL